MIHPVLERRRAGVLLHPSSLPGGGELGELGPDAFRFVDFLQAAGMSVWQILPLGPTHEDLSPYMSTSVHAGNSRLISLELLRQWGWLPAAEAKSPRPAQLCAARAGFEQQATPQDQQDYQDFCLRHQFWLEDFSEFQAIRQDQQGAPWFNWPAPLRDREGKALAQMRTRLADRIEQARFEQFVFFKQWLALKREANKRDIELFGDIPIFVAHDSAEVWAHREYFQLDDAGQPRTVAGVPPDYFSATGQRWGNPHYNWARMAEDGYLWWIKRMRTSLELFDLVRIDHFRGFEAYWEIPGDAETAVVGRWVTGPGNALFKALVAAFPYLPVVAEDLGIITPEVEALRDYWGFPGMKILQFAFGGNSDNPYLPHNHMKNCVAYTGTHDNDTSLGWVRQLSPETEAYVRDYLDCGNAPLAWSLIRATLASTARLAIIPLQDLLELGSDARMNVPGAQEGNWRWRFTWSQLPADLAARTQHLVRLYGR